MHVPNYPAMFVQTNISYFTSKSAYKLGRSVMYLIMNEKQQHKNRVLSMATNKRVTNTSYNSTQKQRSLWGEFIQGPAGVFFVIYNLLILRILLALTFPRPDENALFFHSPPRVLETGRALSWYYTIFLMNNRRLYSKLLLTTRILD